MNAEDKCVHGWTGYPDPAGCPKCLAIERDTLSEDLRRNLETIRWLRHRIERFEEILDDVQNLLILHHAEDRMKDEVCPICTDANNIDLIRALERNRQEQNAKRKSRNEPAPF